MENVKMIVVDDEEMIRELLIDAFELFLNRRVLAFSNAKDALTHIESNNTNFVISDVDMPGEINGLDLLHEVKKYRPDIIFISMSGNPRNAREAEVRGADAFLAKPFKLNDLIKIVEKFIAE